MHSGAQTAGDAFRADPKALAFPTRENGSYELGTVIVSYERPELLELTLTSYRETVTIPHRLVVVDNGSRSREVRELLLELELAGAIELVLLDENRYPGFAANRGFELLAAGGARLLHRSDNDVEYLAGWPEEVLERFVEPELGQLGLRTLEEEGPHAAVGGNMILRRELYDRGLRYGEEPWSAVAFEDTALSHSVLGEGFKWERVRRPCIVHRGIADRTDPYYRETFAVRGIGFPEWA